MEIPKKYLITGMVLKDDIESLSLKVDHILNSTDIDNINKDASISEVNVVTSDLYNTFNETFKNILASVLKEYNKEDIKKFAQILADIVGEENNLQYDVGSYLNPNYNHLVNTTIISVIVAKNYNRVIEKNRQVNIYNVAIAALLCDIGRLARDEAVLENINKRYRNEIEKLKSEYSSITEEIFKKYDNKFHPVYSYLLANNYEVEESVLMAILLHHEKEEGTNSLLNMPLANIEECEYVNIARILKLADLYDVIIHNNVLNNPDNPFINIGKQIDSMVASSFVNPYLTNVLKSSIPLFQVGSKVLLSDGTVGIVNSNDANDYNKPMVLDLNGNYIDLNDEKISVIKPLKD